MNTVKMNTVKMNTVMMNTVKKNKVKMNTVNKTITKYIPVSHSVNHFSYVAEADIKQE